MNLSFYKMQAGGRSWAMMDQKASLQKPAVYAQAARELGGRLRGAAVDGLIVLESGSGQPVARLWSRKGQPQGLPPSALVCVARWAFDTGQAEGDQIHIRSIEGSHEILVLDSRAFGLALSLTAPADSSGRSASFRLQKDGRGLQDRHYLGYCQLQDGRAVRRLDIWDGPLPARPEPELGLAAGVISRDHLSLRSPGLDPLHAAGLAFSAARSLDLVEASLSLGHRGATLLLQQATDTGLFVATTADYCFSGEFWLDRDDPTSA